MATRDWMRDETSLPASPDPSRFEDRDGAYGRPSLLEIGLAAVGLAAWAWCAFEVLSSVIR
jgi:hypothetical protein